jgi:hypothetical protein
MPAISLARSDKCTVHPHVLFHTIRFNIVTLKCDKTVCRAQCVSPHHITASSSHVACTKPLQYSDPVCALVKTSLFERHSCQITGYSCEVFSNNPRLSLWVSFVFLAAYHRWKTLIIGFSKF